MLQYVFMQRAFLVGGVLGAVLPCIGLIIVLRHQSMIGDALSHSSLAGVALGLLLGLDPTVGAMIACLCAVFSIERIRKKLGRYSEMAIAMVLSAGIGLASVLSDFVRSAANFQSYLFGSIVAVSQQEMFLTLGLGFLILILFFALQKSLFLISYSPRSALMAGIPVRKLEFLFSVMTALTVSIASRTVGALIVSSFMVIPAACAMQCTKSFRWTLALSILFSEFFILSGLTLSYYQNLKPGGAFVLVAVSTFIVVVGIETLIRRIGHRKVEG